MPFGAAGQLGHRLAIQGLREVEVVEVQGHGSNSVSGRERLQSKRFASRLTRNCSRRASRAKWLRNFAKLLTRARK